MRDRTRRPDQFRQYATAHLRLTMRTHSFSNQEIFRHVQAFVYFEPRVELDATGKATKMVPAPDVPPLLRLKIARTAKAFKEVAKEVSDTQMGLFDKYGRTTAEGMPIPALHAKKDSPATDCVHPAETMAFVPGAGVADQEGHWRCPICETLFDIVPNSRWLRDSESFHRDENDLLAGSSDVAGQSFTELEIGQLPANVPNSVIEALIPFIDADEPSREEKSTRARRIK